MTAAWMGESGQPYCQFGTAAAIAGDVDGDGYQDVVIGAADYSDDAPDIGKAYLYLGSSSGLGSSPEWTAESDIGKAYFGHAVSSAGDVDGDGLSDVVVGARHYANGEEDEGRAFLYLGSSSSGLEGSAAWTAEGDQVGADFGFAVASAGDVDGDGYGDVAVGAAHYDTGFGIEGAAFLYLGVSSGLEATAVWSETGGQDGSGFGSSLASAGDVDGDGHGDLLVGASGYDGGSTGEGMAGLFLGSPTGLALGAAWATESDQDGAGLGASVASAGDVDGDGRGDFLLGAPYYDGGSEDEGAAFLYLGFAADSGGEDTGPGDSGAGDSGATPGDSSATPGDSGATPGDSAATTDGTDSGSGAEATDKGGGARCGTLSRPRWSLAVLGLGLGLGLRRAGSGR